MVRPPNDCNGSKAVTRDDNCQTSALLDPHPPAAGPLTATSRNDLDQETSGLLNTKTPHASIKVRRFSKKSVRR